MKSRRYFLVLVAIAALPSFAWGHESPEGCVGNGAGASITRTPSGPVRHGDMICYDVVFSNLQAGDCNISNFDGDLVLPDGTSTMIVRNVDIPNGTSVQCPGDARCQTPGPYCYTVNHDHEVTSFVGCPPVASGDSGIVLAAAFGNGVSHTFLDGTAAPCAAGPNGVLHGACCQLCGGECSEIVTENECLPPFRFTLGATCADRCTPLNCDDGVACTVDTCNPTKQVCVRTPTDSLCDDTEHCNGVETCHRKKGCQDGAAPVCDHLSDQCHVGQCDEEDDACVAVPVDDQTSCDDGLFCTTGDVCVAGACLGAPLDCGDGIGCTNDSCDEVIDMCLHVENDAKCDNELFCDGLETCEPLSPEADLLTGCVPGTACSPPCVCDENNDACVCGCPGVPCEKPPICRNVECIDGKCFYPPAGAGTPCPDDGIPCTMDVCDGAGVCLHTPDDSLCPPDANPCTDTICHPALGCTHVNDNANTCDDGLFCTVNDRCVDGNCVTDPRDCGDGNACTLDSCDEVGDACVNECQTPGISCPPSLEFECSAIGDFGEPTVMDDCSLDPIAECAEKSEPGKLPQEQTITRVCTVTNDCGNSASCGHEIEIVDTTPPSLTCPPDRTFECDAIGEPGIPIVSDNCSPAPVVTVEVKTIPSDCRPPATAGISPPPKLIELRTVTATDGAAVVATGDSTGNIAECVQRIEIVDTGLPIVVECPASISGCAGDPLIFVPPTCSDTCGTCNVICTRSDGQPLESTIPDGSLSVRCVAYDECENPSAPCDVAVLDTCAGIPTVSQWGVVVLGLLLLIGAKIRFHRFRLNSEGF